MDRELQGAVDEIRRVADELTKLAGAGWMVEDGVLSARCSAPVSLSGAQIAAALASLEPLAQTELRLTAGGVALRLGQQPGSALDLIDDPTGDPATEFIDPELTAARRAWAGDPKAALELTGTWEADATVYLAKPLSDIEPNIAWRVVRGLKPIEDLVGTLPWWRMAEMVRDPAGPVVFVALDAEVDYRTPMLAIVTVDLLPVEGLQADLPGRRSVLETTAAPMLPPTIVLPEELMAESPLGAETLRDALSRRAGALSWSWLSNSVHIDGDSASLEFFGYRRVSFSLGGDGVSPKEVADEVYRLYQWATADQSPDRVLAVRQVVSLHPGPELPDRPADVRQAAQPLYDALRSNEVAAVLETQRQARAIAIETARQSAEAAQALAKSATERTIASLAAVAGVVVANATAVVKPVDAQGLAIAISALLCFLAAWTVFIEGPVISRPLRDLQSDFVTIARLLDVTERNAILGMSTVKSAERWARVARVSTPVVYLVAATISLLVAHFRFGWLG